MQSGMTQRAVLLPTAGCWPSHDVHVELWVKWAGRCAVHSSRWYIRTPCCTPSYTYLHRLRRDLDPEVGLPPHPEFQGGGLGHQGPWQAPRGRRGGGLLREMSCFAKPVLACWSPKVTKTFAQQSLLTEGCSAPLFSEPGGQAACLHLPPPPPSLARVVTFFVSSFGTSGQVIQTEG